MRETCQPYHTALNRLRTYARSAGRSPLASVRRSTGSAPTRCVFARAVAPCDSTA